LPSDKKPRFFYGYLIVFAGFVIQLIAWGAFTTFGVFFNPLLDQFGWTRELLSGASSLSYLLMGAASIVAGRLGDRFGPRVVMAVCGIFLGLGYLMVSQVNTIGQMYFFYGILTGIGMSGVDVLILSTVARWFVKRRGIMSGAIKVGAGLGMVVLPIVANQLIRTYGWRPSYITLGVIVLVAFISVSMILKRDPSHKGLLPYGELVADPNNANFNNLGVIANGHSFRQAAATRSFWIISAMYFSFVFCVQTVLVHIDPYAQGVGISATNAAGILSIMGGASIVARIVMGTTGDRIGYKGGTVICLVVLVAAFVWLLFTRELWMLYLFAFIYGFAHGGFFTMISPLIAEVFGLDSHGEIFGVVIFSGNIGGAIGPLLAGRIFDFTGSYQVVFFILVAVSVLAMLLSLPIKPTVSKSLAP